MILDRLDIDAEAFAAGTGWTIEPQGACRGDVCVPLPSGGAGSTVGAGRFDVVATADRLGMALVPDADESVWALGPASVSGRALVTAEAPDLVLDDLAGRPFRLSSLRGQKVVLVAWAPY